MESISAFDIFKIGIGPSSSHTMGPWKAALVLIQEINLPRVESIKVELFGSLAKTGKGHGTDLAICMGLCGIDPVTVDPEMLQIIFGRIKHDQRLTLGGSKSIPFNVETDLIFDPKFLPYHPNTMIFNVFDRELGVQFHTFYSVGGGFIEKEGQNEHTKLQDLPYPIDSESDLLRHLTTTKGSIADVVRANELSLRSEIEVETGLRKLWDTMVRCIHRGCHQEGSLPGGLQVKRRAPELNRKLLGDMSYSNVSEWMHCVKSCDPSFANVTKWVSCFALAVNEENAAFGRIVTAPTNGAAGVVPAVLMYFLCFCPEANEDSIESFLLTAAEIGSLFKKGSTISAAMGGCQAEIGVSSSMAAAALTAESGGSPAQAIMAAEIAMEHHLGLTCDPIAGLVQIPCIERNAMGAMKAITASQLALSGDHETSRVSLDGIIETMWATAQDMHHAYKETSEGGLAKHISVMLPEC